MTHRERILGTIRREKVDRIPICFRFADKRTEDFFFEKLGIETDELKILLESDIKFCFLLEDLQMHLKDKELIKYALKKGFATKGDRKNILYDRWGVGWATDSIGQRPVSTVIKDIKKVVDLKIPKISQEGQFHIVDKFFKEYEKEGYAIIIPQYYAIFEKTWLLMGYEEFLINCYENKQFIKILLDKITDYRVEMAKKIVEYNITCGHTGDDFGVQNGPMMSLELWRELFKPRLKKIWAVYKERDIPVVHHSCGDCRLFINDMIEIGLDVLHPVQASAMPIDELKRDFGGKLTFFGGIDCQDILTKGTPDDVRRNVNDTVSILGKDGGLILSPINIMDNVPIENLRALIEAVNLYR